MKEGILLDRYDPDVPVKKAFGEFETLVSNEKLKCLLGWRQQHYWHDEVKRFNP